MNQTTATKESRKIITTLFLKVAGYSLGIVIVAILLGALITQIKGEQTILSWLPLIFCLPINLYLTSNISKKTISRLLELRQSEQPGNHFTDEES